MPPVSRWGIATYSAWQVSGPPQSSRTMPPIVAAASRTCPACGHTAKENRPTQEKFHCVDCGHRAHADEVGALNVLRAGLV
ncbi:zinc ribbon domain-containing protein, partial [Streptomyces sp. BE230]|uniref:zinc ribbon domain-containing protein n=1 Tax=Streptomyces sp. BE230 TaxID=3002526 RepID=UPI003FA77072